MAERKKRQDLSEQSYDNRYSGKYPLSTIIKCEHCRRSFSRKKYTNNTRIYWKCPTNDQQGRHGCENNVTITESELLSKISEYLESLIDDGMSEFYKSVISEANKYNKVSNNERTVINRKIKNIESKANKYKELYALELLSASELTDKLMALQNEIIHLKSRLTEGTTSVDESVIVQEIQKCLGLESITNIELKRIIKTINVNKNGMITIVLQ